MVLLLASMLLPALAAANEKDAHAWLERMIRAVRTLSYEGTFVYLRGGHLESIRIVHSFEGGEERERLLSLNGSPRMVNRDQAAIVCIMPDVHDVSIEERSNRSGIPVLSTLGGERFPEQYLLRILGQARIAERESVVIGVIPKDDYRYGYRLYLDKVTALPLKLDLMDESAKPIEQVMFTALRIFPRQAGEDVAAPLSDERSRAVAGKEKPTNPALKWRFKMLPPGFSVEAAGELENEEGNKVEHLVVTDGFAAVSIYIEPSPAHGKSLLGSTNIGAVNAWGGVVDGFQVTAVGEVPRKTIREIVAAMDHTAVASAQ